MTFWTANGGEAHRPVTPGRSKLVIRDGLADHRSPLDAVVLKVTLLRSEGVKVLLEQEPRDLGRLK